MCYIQVHGTERNVAYCQAGTLSGMDLVFLMYRSGGAGYLGFPQKR